MANLIIKSCTTMTHKQILGHIIISIGEQLCDPESKLSKSIDVSEEQLFALVKFGRILTSPSVQVLYMADLCERWNKSPKTIQNWIDIGLVRKGHKRRGDTRLFWYASEIDEDSKQLVKYGYLQPMRSSVLRLIERCRRFLRFEDCGEK